MRNRAVVMASALVAIFTVVGCGGGSGGGGSVTSVSGSKPLGTLTSSEQTKLCNDTGAYIGRSLSKADTCRLAAFVLAALSGASTDAELRTACSMAESQCNSAPSSGGTTGTCDPIPASCTATVDQYSACVSAEVTATKQSLQSIPSCSTITLADLTSGGTGGDNAPPPQACVDFTAACPGYTVPGSM